MAESQMMRHQLNFTFVWHFIFLTRLWSKQFTLFLLL